MPHSSVPDDGFREIQLSGKQLVFLFMAATVVSVVIFLCGVLVGRGVRSVVGESSSTLASAEPLATEADDTEALASSATQPATTEPPPTPDELSYYERLEKDTAPAETLKVPERASKTVGPTPPPAPVAEAPAAPAQAAAGPRSAPAAQGAPAAGAANPPPSGSGYIVQVTSLQARGEAEAIAKRLSEKGYPAFVVSLSPTPDAPTFYRVSVGKYDSRREAEQIAARLEKEEKFKPWIRR